MPEERKPKDKPKGIAAAVVSGAQAVKYPGYAAYKREAEAMGEDVLPPAEWAAQQKREK